MTDYRAEIAKGAHTAQTLSDGAAATLTDQWAAAWRGLEAEFTTATQQLAELAHQAGAWPPVSLINRADAATRALQSAGATLERHLDGQDPALVARIQTATLQAVDWEQHLTTLQWPDAQRLAVAGVSFGRPDPGQLRAIVERTTGRIEKQTAPLPVEQQVALKQAMIRGVPMGDNPVTTAQRLLAQLGGVFTGGMARAAMIARTETLDAYRAAATATRRQNLDVLDGWVWSCTLSARTCPGCLSMDGTMFPPDADGPDGHQQCRCVAVPVTKPWSALGITGVDEPSPVTDRVSARAWFDDQPTDVQKRMLGAERWQRLNDGRLDWSDMAVQRVNPGWRPSIGVRPLAMDVTVGRPIIPALDPLIGIDLSTYSLDDLDGLLVNLTERQEWLAVERVSEYADNLASTASTRVQPPNVWTPTPTDAFNTRTYEWFEKAAPEEQDAFLAAMPGNVDHFLQQQYAATTTHTAATATRTGFTERDLREQYSNWMEAELQQIEQFTNGNTLTRKAIAQGRTTRNLYQVNDRVAWAWATDEMKQYWAEHGGRMTFNLFRMMAHGDTDAVRYAMQKGAQQW